MIRWYLGGIGAAMAIGWIAARTHLSGYAPLGIFSLGVGLLLGAALVALAKSTNTLCRRRMIAGTVIAAILTIAVQHALVYRDFRQQWQTVQASSPQAALFRGDEPWSPREYLTREATPRRVAFWIVDAVLIGGAALGVVLAWRRRSV